MSVVAELPPQPRPATKWDERRALALAASGQWVRIDDVNGGPLDLAAARNLRARVRAGSRRWAEHGPWDCEIRPVDGRRAWAVYVRHATDHHDH